MNHQQKIKPSEFKAIPRTSIRLEDRNRSGPFEIKRCGLDIVVNPGVYQTSGDSELMVESIKLKEDETFLEIGSGTGIISLALAKQGHAGIGVDINKLAVENSKRNTVRLNITNVQFLQSNVFEKVTGTFDVIIFNPPYIKHEIKDDIDRIFWDPENETKHKFFKEVGAHLKPSGKIYFGWADCADIDVDLPFRLAETNGYKLINSFSKPHPRGEFTFYVLEFKRVGV